VGSKVFPESDILAEVVTQLATARQIDAVHKRVGSTPIVWKSLLSGEIDLYPEYTGTIVKEILKDDSLADEDALRRSLAQQGIVMSPSLGFANPYAIVMLESRAQELGIRTISDLKAHPEVKFVISTEFAERSDGWPTLKQTYQLPQHSPKVMEHGLAYAAVSGGEADATDAYLTDAAVQQFGFRVLEDDARVFPDYESVLLIRQDTLERVPDLQQVIDNIAGSITVEEMQTLNAAVQVERLSPGVTAQEFLVKEYGVSGDYAAPSLAKRLWRYGLQHLFLVATALAAGIVVAIPLGILAAKRQRLEHVILSTAEVIQTIPGLALLALLMPAVRQIGLPGTGPAPVIVALFFYSLLPMIRNTYTGIRDIPHSMRESAEVLGLTPWATLWQIELPLASRLILAGIKTTAVITVGYATLGGLIGAGGFGEPIAAGLASLNTRLLLEGAVPAAMLALGVKVLFEIAERFVVPKGLRIQSGG
jgi:osmoprotectant transport system permease protein